MTDTELICVILVSSGSRGDRLLFRYPFETEDPKDKTSRVVTRSPYSVRISEDLQANRNDPVSSVCNGALVGYSDKILANLLAVKSDLCGSKFEVKINDIIFVGYPMLLHHVTHTGTSLKREAPSMISFNVAFALKTVGDVDECMIGCYQDVAKQLAVALRHEEKRCGYLSNQKGMMLSIHEETATLPEVDSYESPFGVILKKSLLAKHLSTVYDQLSSRGVVQLYINGWIHINVCVPHKLHNLPDQHHPVIKPDAIQRCVSALRPYHAMLLLVEDKTLLESLPLDCSPSLRRLIQVASPLKRLQDLASDADLSLSQVFHLVGHLVYWAKATVMYPLCESNVYMLSPHTDTFVNSRLVEKFVEQFPGMSLPAVMCEFSLPTPLGEHRDVLGSLHKQAIQVQMVVWLLQHRLLVQLHTYVYLVPTSKVNSAPTANATQKNKASQFLSPPAEEYGLRRVPSASDVASVNSDESVSLTTFSTFSTKSPTVEVASDGVVITEETRAQWRLQDSLLGNLTPEEKQSIMTIPAANNPEDLKLFARLCPYFNGRHHLEEIMYYENVRRSHLLTLLDKFRDVLITCQHEEPATTFCGR